MSIPEIDLHGLTLDEALSEVEREINHEFIQETDDRRIEFVVGWGYVLRERIEDYLVVHPLVKEIRADGASLRITLEDL
jgi:DNA-nicking Smr family endonuclease